MESLPNGYMAGLPNDSSETIDSKETIGKSAMEAFESLSG